MSYGLLGRNISYSRSPDIHNCAMKTLKIPGEYCLYDLRENEIYSFLSQFLQNGGRGLNVTQPYKALVAQHIGSSLASVNTLKNVQGKWVGASTDGAGLQKAIERFFKKICEYRKIVVLGAGAVLPALKDVFNAQEFIVLARKPLTGMQNLSCSVLQNHINDTDLLIQATSAPLFGDDLSYLLPAIENYQGDFVDLTYGKTSALYKFLQQNKRPSIDGLPMLIEQARACQEIWWGKSAAYDDLRILFGDTV